MHAERTTAGLPSCFDPSMPWDFVLGEAAKDTEFWTEHVDKKAFQFATNVRSSTDLTDEGLGAIREAKSATAAASRGGRRREESGSEEAAPQKKRKKQRKSGGKGATGRVEVDRGAGLQKGGQSKDPKTTDGKHFRDENGVQLCWNWNRKAGGCKEPCPQARSHKCEWCRDTGHRTIDHKPE